MWLGRQRFSPHVSWSQVLAKGFLGFDVPVAVAFIERVRAIADYIRAQSDGAAAFFARPALGTSQKMHSNSLRAVTLVNHQATDFGTRVRFDHAIDKHREPSCKLTADLRYEHSVFVRMLHASEPFGNFIRGRRIAELAGKFRDSRVISRPGFANLARKFFRGTARR